MCMRWVRLGQLLGLPPALGHDACLDSLFAPFLHGLDVMKGLDVAPQLISDMRTRTQEPLVTEDPHIGQRLSA